MNELTFIEKRERVVAYVRRALDAQGVGINSATGITTKLYFMDSRDIEDLYACITSDLPADTISAIVAHDVSGLIYEDKHFLPKSRQFRNKA